MMMQPKNMARMTDDFTQVMRLLESARQLAEMNNLTMLVYLVEVAKAEARSHRFELRERKRGQIVTDD
jgi:hypothetical protein